MPRPAAYTAYERRPGSPDKKERPKAAARSNVGPAARSRDDRTSSDAEAVTRSSLFQPRVAVLLGVPKNWHPVLFTSRALACAPAVWWGAPSALVLVLRMALQLGLLKGDVSGQVIPPGLERFLDARLGFVESALAIIWCGSSAYLSFFFTDCLMSRWLVNYTPQATIVRLLTINAVNGYVTSWALYLIGGSEDPRLLLPAWIGISSALTALYHVTQRKINIRKETSMSISVFSIASFISMVALLVQLYLSRSDYPTIPLATFARKAWYELEKAAVRLVEYGNSTTRAMAEDL
ncbi:hypothetical protein GQ53DRAFT_662159 [Thozetella sp. PMI_491]|nr:hypothetical protein GQ53DRAFT_662159 [Thozetella sp. PMI_491]